MKVFKEVLNFTDDQWQTKLSDFKEQVSIIMVIHKNILEVMLTINFVEQCLFHAELSTC